MHDNFLIRTYEQSDMIPVIHVWEQCNLIVPANNPEKDIQLKTAFQPDLFFVGTLNNTVIATIMVGYDGHRGGFNYVGVLPEFRQQGFGRILIEHALQILKNLGCPKVNIQIRETNQIVIKFYEKLGFKKDPNIPFGYRF